MLLVRLYADPGVFEVHPERGDRQARIDGLSFRFQRDIVEGQRGKQRQADPKAERRIAAEPRGFHSEIAGVSERLAVQNFQNLAERSLETDIRRQSGRRLLAVQPQKVHRCARNRDVPVFAAGQCQPERPRVEDRLAVNVLERRKRMPVARRDPGKGQAAVYCRGPGHEVGLGVQFGTGNDPGLVHQALAQVRKHPLAGAGGSDIRGPKEPKIVHRNRGGLALQMHAPSGFAALAAASGLDAAAAQLQLHRLDQYLPGQEIRLNERAAALQGDGFRLRTGDMQAAGAERQSKVQGPGPEVGIERPCHGARNGCVQCRRCGKARRQQRRQQGGRHVLQMREGRNRLLLPRAPAGQARGMAERLDFDCLDLKPRQTVDGASLYDEPVHRNAAPGILRIGEGPAGALQVRFERHDGVIRRKMDGDAAAQRRGQVAEPCQQRMESGDVLGAQSVQPGGKRRPAGVSRWRQREPDIRFRLSEAQGRRTFRDRLLAVAAKGKVEPGHAPFHSHDVIDDREHRPAHAKARKAGSAARRACGKQSAEVDFLGSAFRFRVRRGQEADRTVGPPAHRGADAEQFHFPRHDPASQDIACAQGKFQPLRLHQRPALQGHEPRIRNLEAQQPAPVGPCDLDRLHFHPVAGFGTGKRRLDARRQQGEVHRPLGQPPDRESRQRRNEDREDRQYPQDMPRPYPQ